MDGNCKKMASMSFSNWKMHLHKPLVWVWCWFLDLGGLAISRKSGNLAMLPCFSEGWVASVQSKACFTDIHRSSIRVVRPLSVGVLLNLLLWNGKSSGQFVHFHRCLPEVPKHGKVKPTGKIDLETPGLERMFWRQAMDGCSIILQKKGVTWRHPGYT